MIINSLQNPKIKNLIKLKKSSERKKQRLFMVEGEREIKIALSTGHSLKEFYLCEDYNKNKENLKIEKATGVSKEVFDKVSYRESPDGYLAVFAFFSSSLESLNLSNNPFLIILDSIEKPGNLGAILRTADASGIDAIVLTAPKIDIYNPNVIRASQGTIFSIPLFISNVGDVKKFCHSNDIKIFATTPRASNDYINEDFRGSSAIVLGSEDKGLDEKWLNMADEKIKIEMKGKIDSLNLSVSTAIIIFEALRQRKFNN